MQANIVSSRACFLAGALFIVARVGATLFSSRVLQCTCMLPRTGFCVAAEEVHRQLPRPSGGQNRCDRLQCRCILSSSVLYFQLVLVEVLSSSDRMMCC